MPDYEIVEMLLALGILRKDTKPLAKALLSQFKSFPTLLAADYDDLCAVKGMTKNAATGLKLVEASAKRMMQQDLIGKPILNSWSRLTDYLYATMAQEKKEHFRVLFLDRKNNLIADEIQQSGTVDQTPIYPREVLKRALELCATALILVHNHPSGDPSPSAQDIQMTNTVIDAAKALDMVVHDHIIVSQKGYTSMRNEGFLDG
jgi:DNA repair protein RadC